MYEEILPQLADPFHIQLIKDALDATKANVEADKKGNVSSVEKLSRKRETMMMKDKSEIPMSKNVDILLEKLRWL